MVAKRFLDFLKHFSDSELEGMSIWIELEDEQKGLKEISLLTQEVYNPYFNKKYETKIVLKVK